MRELIKNPIGLQKLQPFRDIPGTCKNLYVNFLGVMMINLNGAKLKAETFLRDAISFSCALKSYYSIGH